MLILQGVTYAHPNRDLLFNNISLVINKQDKAALVGNNGTGKSTLLQIMAGMLPLAQGIVKAGAQPYYVPQLSGQYNEYTIARALRVHGKLHALQAILEGQVTETNMALLDDDWAIEERCNEALAHWQLDELNLQDKMGKLSGGQKTKVLLAGIMIHRPQLVLLDEPSNHLDIESRQILYDYISHTTQTLVAVSHDRTLLQLLNPVYELTKRGITVYGGNYDLYTQQKAIEANAFNNELKSKEKALRKAKDVEKETLERQQKLDARGKKKQENAGLPTIAMNTLRNNAEKSTARIKDIHTDKIQAIYGEIDKLRNDLPDKNKMKMGFDEPGVHKGKILVTAKDINFAYKDRQLWQQAMSFVITAGQRICIKGKNGAGKTTLVKIITNELQPQTGTINRADMKMVYVDQDYSLIDNSLSVYEQVQKYNTENIEEHEVKSRLTHFLFTQTYWDKRCAVLSGGEKMRLMLCCLALTSLAPDMMILDEPTNNLDIQNADILTATINGYRGTVIVISHDAHLLKEIAVDVVIDLGG